jgi:hypothetical protein
VITEVDATGMSYTNITVDDLRSQDEHTSRRGRDAAHVTCVSPCSIGCGGHESSAMLATCLQSKRLLCIRDTDTDTPPIS